MTSLSSRAVLAAALALAALAAGAQSAEAGTWTQVVCAGSGPAPVEGMTPLSAGTAATATDRCNPATGGLVALVSSATAVAPGTAASWTYKAPGSSTIAGGTISLSLFAPGGVAYVATPGPTFDAADTLASCASGAACGSSVGGQLTGVVPINHPGGTQIYEIAECQGSCPAGGGGAGLFAQVNVFGMSIRLANGARPAGAGFGGGLLSAGAGGTQPLSFSATDPGGPGIFGVTVTIDGRTVYDGTPDTNDGRCVPAGKDAAGVTEWLYAQPCPPALGVSVPVDTTQFADGAHTLHVVLTDAAGNTGVVLDRTVTVANHGSAPADPGYVNDGQAACAGAQLSATFGSGSSVRVPLPGRATLRGRLTCQGRPLAAAALEISSARRGGPTAETELRTDQNGNYSYALGPGPSRHMTIAYRTSSDATAPAATAAARLYVTPSIAMSIRPERVRNGQSITYRGQVFGGYIPTGGLPLDVEYRDGTRWRIFDTTRARAKDGRFVYRYTFRRTTVPIVYTFRVVIPASGVVGYPYEATGSRPRSVRVDP